MSQYQLSLGQSESRAFSWICPSVCEDFGLNAQIKTSSFLLNMKAKRSILESLWQSFLESDMKVTGLLVAF